MFDLFWIDFGETISDPSHFRRSLLSVDCLNSVVFLSVGASGRV